MLPLANVCAYLALDLRAQAAGNRLDALISVAARDSDNHDVALGNGLRNGRDADVRAREVLVPAPRRT